MGEQFSAVDQTEGEIDVLSQRLAGVRTLAYLANRPDWLRDPAHWQGRTRALEDRLSDTLHQKLMARFIDRRTSVLMRALGDNPEIATFADAMNPMGRIGDPYLDIAPVALFLAGEGCRYLTGNTLFVDGGSHINGVAWTPDLDRAGDDQQGSAIRKGQEERRI